MGATVPVQVTVNGELHDSEVPARMLLVHYLRDELGLTGTHVGCDTSNCGACTCLLDGESVKSCTVLAVQCDGASVKTIEGMAGRGGELHPLQEGFWAQHGLQCGYCTPGMIMAAEDLLARRTGERADHGGGGAQGAGGQPLPLHRLPQHRQGDPGGRRGDAGGCGSMSTSSSPHQARRPVAAPQGGSAAHHRPRDVRRRSRAARHAARRRRALTRGACERRLDRRLARARASRHQGGLHGRGHERSARPAADGLGAARASRSRLPSAGRWFAAASATWATRWR